MYFVMENSLLKHFNNVTLDHIPRIENEEANELAQIASGYKLSKETLEELVEVKEKLASNEDPIETSSMSKFWGAEEIELGESFQIFGTFKILAIDSMLSNDWQKSVVEYLLNPTETTKWKIKYRALSYVVMGNELFQENI